MKIKISEATELQLDWLVAKCLGTRVMRFGAGPSTYFAYIPKRSAYKFWEPTKNWKQGGPIIERELIRVIAPTIKGVDWVARIKQSLPANMNGWFENVGPTPLIAAMRCYVTSKLGNEVEVPKELKR